MAWLGLFGLGGILAVIFGHVAKNEIKKSGGQISGDGLATAGLILGYYKYCDIHLGILPVHFYHDGIDCRSCDLYPIYE